ncbi:MAG: hypothetical protein LBS97_07275 [Treponema sp.]|jgi:hypothetical protein|nr:hypothetical protein [Treponema sp.]
MQKQQIIKRTILTVILVLIGVISWGPVSARQGTYNPRNEKGLQKTLTQKTVQVMGVWGATKLAGGLISILQSFEVGVNLGIAGSLNPLEGLAAVNNVLDKISDVCLFALGALIVEKCLLTISGWAAWKIIIPACILLCIISLWAGRYKDDTKRVLVTFGLIGFAVCIAVPASIQVSQIIENRILSSELDRTIQDINQQESTVQTMESEARGLSASKIIDSIKNVFSKAGDLVNNLISSIINYIMIFVVTTIILPILTIAGIGFVTKYAITALLPASGKR